MLYDDIMHRVYKHTQVISVQNVAMIYTLAKLYNMKYFGKVALRLIDSCYFYVVKTKNFLELDFYILLKILSSSSLNTDSEIEISNSLIIWLKHKLNERCKFAKQLLYKVRLTLLSQYELQHLLDSISSLSISEECVNTLKEVNMKQLFLTKSSCYYTSRCCDHESFDVLIFGGYKGRKCDVGKCVYQVKTSYSIGKFKRLPSMIVRRCNSNAVYLKGDVYLIGGENRSGYIRSIEKYSCMNKTWSKLAFDMLDDRIRISTCSFIDRIFIIGGKLLRNATKSCFNFNDNSVKAVAEMNFSRQSSACIVFRGKIVVCGGCGVGGKKLKCVESYDVFGDRWTSMPDMIYARKNHNLVVVSNKLFVIGTCRGPCEVFDTSFNKFVFLKKKSTINKVLSIGNRIVVFPNKEPIICYDFDEKCLFSWLCKTTQSFRNYSCVKIPVFQYKFAAWWYN